jgi:hypothetical protein
MVAQHEVCPSCGGPKWPGYELCNACRLDARSRARWPYYSPDRHPLKKCPNCGKWMLRSSASCPDCQLALRRGEIDHIHVWIAYDTYHLCSVCGLAEPHDWSLNGAKCLGLCKCGDMRHLHDWEIHDTTHECRRCGVVEPHHWVLEQTTCYGKCQVCGAERQFPTPTEAWDQVLASRRHDRERVAALLEQ